MSSTGGGKKKAAAAAAGDPTTASSFAGFGPSDSSAVDDLLRAVEDDLLLNLRVDAHSTGRPSSLISSASSSSSAFLDPDLSRRFEALRSAPPPHPHPTTSSTAAAARPAAKAAADGDDEWGRILGDDLAARFAALKGTSPASAADLNPVADGEGREQGSKGPVEEVDEEDDEVDEDGVSKKEVEKLMQWAKDAARLDPSTKSDEEDEESDDEDDEEMEMKKKKKKVQQPKEQQEKSKPRKWFLF